MAMYNDTVIDHFMNPHNVGEIEDASGVGTFGSPVCGDMMQMSIKVLEHQRQIIDTFVNSVYVFDDRVVLNFNFTDDSKTISREEVLGSSAVDNAPPNVRPFT